jgi:hypothetical protein
MEEAYLAYIRDADERAMLSYYDLRVRRKK